MRPSGLLEIARLGRSGIRRRPARALAVFAGIAAAAMAFALLTSETASSNLTVTRTVRQNFRAAYDILVRPRGSVTSFERRHHLVADGFLSSLFGGISMAQYHQIASLRGVSLAAPVANVGYFLVTTQVFVPFPRSVAMNRASVYRVGLSWDVHHGLASYPGQTNYVYYTPKPIRVTGAYTGLQTVPGGRSTNVCGQFYNSKPVSGAVTIPRIGAGVKHPYRPQPPGFYCDSARPSFAQSMRNYSGTGSIFERAGRPGVEVIFNFPVLVAGVDPNAEERLVGLGHAVTSGRYLQEGAGLSKPEPTPGLTNQRPLSRYYPVIASVDTFLDEAAKITVSRLDLPKSARLATLLGSSHAYASVTAASRGRTLGSEAVSPTTAWRALLPSFNGSIASSLSVGYWRVSSARYAPVRAARATVRPKVVANNPRVWSDNSNEPSTSGGSLAPPGSADTWYRSLRIFGGSGAIMAHPADTFLTPMPRLVGVFNPARLEGFSPLSRVPLQTFYPPQATAGSPASRRLLGNAALGPTMNLGGYLAQPPLLLTTLQGAIALDDGHGEAYTVRYKGGSIRVQAYRGASPRAPISTVEVRVAGVHGPTPLSLARIRLVAEQIANRTGLQVTITAGSSPTDVGVRLARGRFGTPALDLSQQWSLEGVDSGIIEAQNTKDLAVLVLVALTCVLFLAATTYSGIRERRLEIATLEALGWPVVAVWQLIVGEAAQVSLLAGLVVTAAAAALTAAGLLLDQTLVLLLLTPVAVLLAVASATVAVLLALRGTPLRSMASATMPGGSRLRARSLAGVARAQLLQNYGRSLLAVTALGLAVAVATSLLGVDIAFSGAVAHDVLGNAVAIYVRGADLATVALVALIGAACVADVVFSGIRERRVELATLAATGWSEQDFARLTMLEGVTLGFTGSLIGATVGAITLALLGGSSTTIVAMIAISTVAGVAVSALALAIPVLRARSPLQEGIAGGAA